MDVTKIVIDATTQANLDSWLNGDYDASSKEEIRRLQRENPEELVNAFYKHLEFGTGGLRGVMGPGTNRMNPYTVRAATQGLANYILKQTKKGSVLIGYDCRHHSRDFAIEAATVLAANGIKVYLYKELRPVPLVSFGVIYKKCTAGIMITASHNPPKYNGYKVYWDYGGQVLPPHDQGIIDEVNHVRDVKRTTFPHQLIEEIDTEVDTAFLKAIRPWQHYPEDNTAQGNKLHIVYTSLHGAGITMVPKALADWGFSQVSVVESQRKPDGDFPTVASPNPEEHAALKLGIDQLQATQADILIGTDPDTDRIGVVAMHQGQPVLLNGNEIACIAVEHICQALKQSKKMPPKPVFVKTIVTSELMKTIAEHHGAQCLDVLTGFKYIGQKIAQWAEEAQAGVPTHHFLFGGEESYGYLLGTHARDKDAVVAAVLVAEIALHLKLQGKTLIDFLYEIYATHGVYREQLFSLVFEGKEGAEHIAKMMNILRTNPPKKLGGVAVTTIEDYQAHQTLHLATGHHEPLLLPRSNVIRIWLEDGTKIVARPSGTEPKLKLYCGVVSHRHTHIPDVVKSCDAKLQALLKELETMMSPPKKA